MQKATSLETKSGAPSLPAFWQSLTFAHLAFATVLMTYGLIVLGGAVRVTDSGTACPDWPLCHGRLLPRLEEHVLIEYSHRLVASIVGLFIVAMALMAWRRCRGNRFVAVTAVLAVLLLGAQVLAGAATVNTETDADVVALHLSIALTLFGTLIVLALAAYRPRVESAGLPVLPIVVGLGALALVISGAYVSQEGAGLAYSDWPLFDGKIVSSGSYVGDLHYAHRLLAGGLGFLVLLLAFRTWRRERRPAVVMAVALAVVLYIAQVLMGAANIWLELATSVRILHLALASALWAVLVFAAAWSYLRPAATTETA